MTPTAEEKRKSIHTRKTRELSRMRIAYLRQTSFNGKIAFLYVRVPTHLVYFCVYVYSLARARSSKSVMFGVKIFPFFSKSSFFERSNAWEFDSWTKNFHLMTSFFLMSTQEKMMRWEWEPYQYVYGCVYEVVRKMDDGRLASVVLYNFISIYYHLHLNL